MASMERKWEECFGDQPKFLMLAQDSTEAVSVIPCYLCEAMVLMEGDEPGMDHVRFHDELHRGLHP